MNEIEQAIDELLNPSFAERLGKLVSRLDKQAARITALEALVAELKEKVDAGQTRFGTF
jgi:hypothetical protein